MQDSCHGNITPDGCYGYSMVVISENEFMNLTQNKNITLQKTIFNAFSKFK